MENLIQKLKEFRVSRGYSQREIAEILDIPQTTWSGYERGRSNPNVNVLIELEKLGFNYKSAFNLATEEADLSKEEALNKLNLASGLPKDMSLEEAGEITRQFQAGEYTIFKYSKPIPQGSVPAVKSDESALTLLPLYSQKASAGAGEEPTQLGEITSYIPILITLLRGANPKNCGLLKVKGDSMTDIGIYDGDFVIFDTSQVEGDGVYVITVGDLTRVKRLENRVIEQKIIISSENQKRYPKPEELSYEQATALLTIHGKVIAWFHSHFY